jgi:hypothetical protein
MIYGWTEPAETTDEDEYQTWGMFESVWTRTVIVSHVE